MAILRGISGGVALGVTAGGGTIGTAVAASHLLQCDGFGEAGAANFYDSRGQALVGYEEGTSLTWMDSDAKSFTLSGNLDDLNAAIWFALACGSDTVSTIGSTTKQHLTTPVTSDVELPYFTVYFKHSPVADTSTLGSLRFTSCILDQLTISGSPGQPLRYSATILSTGATSAITTDISGLTKPNLATIRFGNTEFVYTTATPTAITADPGTGLGTAANYGGGAGNGWTSNTDLSTALKSFSLTINNNSQALFGGGQTGGSAAALFRTGRTISMNASFHFQHGSNMTTGFKGLNNSISTNANTWGMIFRNITASAVDGTYNYGLEILMPKVTITAVDMDKTLGPRGISISGVASQTTTPLYSIYPHVWTSIATDFA